LELVDVRFGSWEELWAKVDLLSDFLESGVSQWFSSCSPAIASRRDRLALVLTLFGIVETFCKGSLEILRGVVGGTLRLE
jgi:hypothetical protein